MNKADLLVQRPPLAPLPADALIPEVLAALHRGNSLVLEATPGAGKTTRIPPALLSLVQGEVLVMEPRRLAARMAARRVATELGERLGKTVGYKVRFDEVSGPETRLFYVTEGVLTRRMASDPELRGVGAVVLDEFHERHLDTDLALALLQQLQQRRPELKIVVMSATLDTGPIAAFLGDAPVLQASGRVFPLEITHLPYSPLPLELQVANAVRTLLQEGNTGHTLIFLPGIAEIRRAMRACEDLARTYGRLCLPLYSDLSLEEQDRVVAPSTQSKLIFATNVAESSITVDGVMAVVDSGLARVASHSPWTGLPSVTIARISKASAQQRAGRAGRTGPGRVLRLYPEADFAQRSDQELPALLREDLTPLVLTLRAMGLANTRALRWLDEPPPDAVRHAEELLDRLGAEGGEAARLARLPVAPRLARVLLEATEHGVQAEALTAAALLARGYRADKTDLLEAIEGPLAPEVQKELDHLRRSLRTRVESLRGSEDDLLRAFLRGFPDRVGRLRPGGQVLHSAGGALELKRPAPPYEFMVIIDAEERKEQGLPLARLVARIEPEWLLDLFPERMREVGEVLWNRSEERAEQVTTLRYDELILQKWREVRPHGSAAAALLSAKALEAGLARFVDGRALANLLQRAQFAGLPPLDTTAALQQLCTGLSSFAELKKCEPSLLAILEAGLDRERLRRLAPPTLRLPSGRETKVHYEEGKSPWIASRLQDFFGLQETPRLGAQRVPVVAHLLAPNQRAVQTTDDLAGFWERLYPQVRKELSRRYPRHAWPEKPL